MAGKVSSEVLAAISQAVEGSVQKAMTKAMEDFNQKYQRDLEDIKNSCVRSSEAAVSVKSHLESKEREKNVIVFGVPESTNESTDMLLQTLETEVWQKLGTVGVLIDDSFRLGKRDPAIPRPRPVLVKFVRKVDCNKVLSLKKNLGKGAIVIKKDKTKEEKSRDAELWSKFQELKAIDKAINMRIGFGGVMTIWKDNKPVKKYIYSPELGVVEKGADVDMMQA